MRGGPTTRRPGSLGVRALVRVIRYYQRFLSPLLGPRCRFAPSCSAYAIGALQGHGGWRGGWLAACRLARCHPFHPGGHDPVPPRRSGTAGTISCPQALGDRRSATMVPGPSGPPPDHSSSMRSRAGAPP